MIDANVIIVLIVLLTQLNMKTCGSFVKVGDYPDYKKYGINEKDCGLRFMPTIIDITFDTKCFLNKYTAIKVDDIEGRTEYGKRQINGRVAHSTQRLYGEAPWAVYLKFEYWFFHGIGTVTTKSCSGVLITTLWVLTAAHCFDSGLNEPLRVTAGNGVKAGLDSRLRAVVIIPAEYKPTLDNWDIALVRLNQPFERTPDNRHLMINPICLPNTGQRNDNEEMATLFGYGAIDVKGNKDHKLRKGEILLDPYRRCPAGHVGIMCYRYTTQGNATSCIGDSGGGVVQYEDKYRSRAILVGTVISGNPTICGTTISYYHSTSLVMDWILETIKNNTVIP